MILKTLSGALILGGALWFSIPSSSPTLPAHPETASSFANFSGVIPTQRVGTGIGDTAPEISLTNPKGKTMSLSELRGSLVLVDFWASWCGPCRRENPNVVTAYKKYQKAKFKTADGFEVFSVSLDSDVARWESAIKQDQLDWKWHVSDLKRWQSEAAAVYGVNSIPMSFLIDENGVIVAKNLRGFELHRQIDRYVESF